MSIILSAGGDSSNDIQIEKLTDLATPQNSAATLFKLADTINEGLNQPVSSFPATNSSVNLKYQSGNNAWKLGNFTFGLSGDVSGRVSVLRQGQNLLTYVKKLPTTINEGLDADTDSKSQGKITVPDGEFYVLVELNLTLAANGAAKVQLGSVGIQGSAGTSDTLKVGFYKKVSGATLLKDALQQSFAGFVLPLHPQTLEHLQPGDYLYHQFNGTLNLGFGATLGLDEVFFSGQYIGAIPTSPAVPIVTASAKVGLNLDASLGVSFKYTESFEAMLWTTDKDTAHLHLYKNHSTDPAFKASLTVGVIAEPAVKISPASLSSLMQKALTGNTGVVAAQIMQGSALNQVTTWVDDAQKKMDSWLKPLKDGKAALELAIDDLNSSFLLLDVTFDLTKIGFSSAWKQVLAGDFQAALKQGNSGMTLDPGSGLEDFHHQKTDVSLNLFGKFKAEWSESQITNYSIIYSGNNTFKLVENIGLEDITNVNGSGREVDLYFAAEGTETLDGRFELKPPELHVLLKATNNRRFGNAIAQILSLAATGPVALQLHNQVLAAAEKGHSKQTLELVFEPGAYGELKSSTLNPDGTITNEDLDKINYNSFADAAWEAEPGVFADASNFSVHDKMDLTYEVWRGWNLTSIGKEDHPNRRTPGDAYGSDAVAYLDHRFDSPPTLHAIPVVLMEASGFMNLCEDLTKLAVPEGGVDPWKALCRDLGYIIHHDVPVDFLAPAGYALTELVRKAGAQLAISGPAANAAQEPSVTVTLRYSRPV
jgi:hypothetical protein